MKAIHHMNEHFMNIYFSISVLKCARSLNHLMCQRVSNYRIYIYIYIDIHSSFRYKAPQRATSSDVPLRR